MESDSFVGVAMILEHFENAINFLCIIKRVYGLLQNFDFIALQHVHREGNFAPDFLSHYTYSCHRGIHELKVLPSGLYKLGIAYIC